MLKAAAGVLAGFVSMGGIAVGLDTGFARLFPDQYGPLGEIRSLGMLLFVLVYTLVSCGLGGWVTAVIAREKASGAVMILTVLIIAMSIVNLTLVPTQLPVWWRVACLILVVPAVVLGGWSGARRIRRIPVRSAA